MSQAGQTLFLAALVLAAARGQSAALALSSMLAATLAAAVLFGLPGGALADSWVLRAVWRWAPFCAWSLSQAD